ncbi:HAD-IA family hydrolase [Lactococcus laudensis]|uniref:HAD-IA family hydrolase n=1 Tax=Pseudolactococcus laudensis TaxID=1494461 RepID=A0A7V8MZ61_9LACT|nr:HAD-IA family hydrolase [Lactococcus laudensis]MBA0015639.1 HAD-IA family hydrolase [Lactococcus laudensis]MBW9280626.1 HAD family hydrolase [Lactococcus laudensis]
MIKIVIFDMDGVLVDSEYTFLETKTDMLKTAGFPKDVSYQYQFMGTTFEVMWTIMKEELGLPESISFYINDMNERREVMIARDGIRAIKGAQDLVKRLFEAGFKLAVASSSPKHEIVRAMTELGLVDYFEVLVSGEEVAHSKPAPDVFLEAAERLGVSAQDAIIIEDTKNGSLAARRAGAYVIGFENPNYPAQDLSNADIIVTDYQELTIEKLQNLKVI